MASGVEARRRAILFNALAPVALSFQWQVLIQKEEGGCHLSTTPIDLILLT